MALSDGPKHGYEVAKYIEDKSHGFFKMAFGSLYPILHKLEKNNLVTVEIENEDSARPRKVYRLTKLGKQQATQETADFVLFYKATTKLVPS